MIPVKLTLEIVTTTCCVCGVPFGMNRGLYDARLKDGKSFWCPNGHSQMFTENTDDKIRRLEARLKDAQRWEMQAVDRAKAAERSLSATKGQVTKLKKRITAGVCPYCTRHFTALERHIHTKHPEHVRTDDAASLPAGEQLP